MIAPSSKNVNYKICNSINPKHLVNWGDTIKYDDWQSDSASLHFWPRFTGFLSFLASISRFECLSFKLCIVWFLNYLSFYMRALGTENQMVLVVSRSRLREWSNWASSVASNQWSRHFKSSLQLKYSIYYKILLLVNLLLYKLRFFWDISPTLFVSFFIVFILFVFQMSNTSVN